MKDDSVTGDAAKLTAQFDGAARPRLTVDLARYEAWLDGSDMTPGQKAEFIDALWTIIVAFVDLGFGVHPLREACGQVAETDSSSAAAGPDVVGFRDTDL